MKMLDKEYIAYALINVKEQIFGEKFITIYELNQFGEFLQNEFKKGNIDVVITSKGLNSEDFNTYDVIIKKSNKCSINTDTLSQELLNVLYNKDVVTSFLHKLEEEKIKKLGKILKIEKTL